MELDAMVNARGKAGHTPVSQAPDAPQQPAKQLRLPDPVPGGGGLSADEVERMQARRSSRAGAGSIDQFIETQHENWSDYDQSRLGGRHTATRDVSYQYVVPCRSALPPTTTAATTIDDLPCIASLAGGATLLACQQGSGFDSPWRSRRSDHLF